MSQNTQLEPAGAPGTGLRPGPQPGPQPGQVNAPNSGDSNAAEAAASGLLGRLSVGQKLALAGLLLGVPFAVTTGALINQQNQQIQHLRTQQLGQKLLLPLDTTMQNTQLLRLSSVRFLQASQLAKPDQTQIDTLSKTLDTQRQTIKQALNSIRDGAKAAGFDSVVKQANQAIQDFETLNFSVSSNSLAPAEAQTAYTDLLRNTVLPMFDNLADVSELKLASDVESAQLTDAATSVMPRNMSTAGAVVSGTIGVITKLGKPNAVIDAGSRATARQQWETSNDARTQITGKLQQIMTLAPATKPQLQPVLDNLQKSSDAVFSKVQDGVLSPVRLQVTANELNSLTPAYAKGLFGALDSVTNVLGDQLNQQLAARTRSRDLLALGLLLAAALLGTLLYLISRAITQPLARLTTASRQLSDGQLNVHVPVTTADELGVLSGTFNTAAEQLRANAERAEQERLEALQLQQNVGQFLDVTMDIADGDLTKRGKVTEDVLGNVVDSINLMVEELAGTLRDVQHASQSVNGGSRTMLATTEQIEQGATTTAAETQRVAQQAQQINAQIQEMARIAQASAETARQALAASQQGQQAVSSTLEGMNTIRQSTQSVAERVQSLSQRSEQIQDILDSISHIASQTNLLSLHASIEAAGAGEAGNRFSVVAEEVRQLADESAAATSRITALVQGIQAEIREVAASMQASAQQVENGYAVAGQAGQRLEQIGKLSEESAQLATQISQAATEQVRGVESVGQGVQQIAQIAEASQQSVQQGRSAAEQLQHLAQQLDQSLTRFRLPS